MDIFELTVPFEKNIEERNRSKSDKYAHFVEDTKVTAFEIGSRGYVSPANKSRLQMLQKFLKAGTSLTTFQKNISALSVYSSYHIFLCRKDSVWREPDYLGTPFP